MAHIRPRYLKSSILQALKHSPSLSVIGMRQTGKTTLMREIVQTYLTLDDDRLLSQIRNGEWNSIELAQTPVGIDEAQKFPGLFDRVKLLIDQRKQMGRFVLTGSVRFLSKRQIRESLTGRTVILECIPFLISESHTRPLNTQLIEGIFHISFGSKKFDQWMTQLQKNSWVSDADFEQHFERGGLPGICFRREERVRADLFSAHLETLLLRDLQLLYPTRVSVEKLKALYLEICAQQGLLINESELARRVGLTSPTVKMLISAFEALFLLRRHGDTIYAEDGGLASFVLRNTRLSETQRWRAFLFRELCGRVLYSFGATAQFSSFKTRGGAEVPFCLDFGKKGSLGMTLDPESQPSEKSLRSLAAFLKGARTNPRFALALHRGTACSVIRQGIVVCPIHWMV